MWKLLELELCIQYIIYDVICGNYEHDFWLNDEVKNTIDEGKMQIVKND